MCFDWGLKSIHRGLQHRAKLGSFLRDLEFYFSESPIVRGDWGVGQGGGTPNSEAGPTLGFIRPM